jgi:superfamily II RNA helicase
MAGRAGRRGKDDKGIVYYLPDRKPEEAFDVEQMMVGKQSSITSQMNFGHEFILKAMLSGHHDWKDIVTKSYWHKQNQDVIDMLVKERDAIVLPQIDQAIVERWELEEAFKNSINAAKKKAQGELESWKNRHPGPKWDAMWKDYIKTKSSMTKIAALNETIQHAQDVMRTPLESISILEEQGYIGEDGKLTKLGVMAAEINEGDALDMSRKFLEKTWHELQVNDLICELANYVEHKKDEAIEDAIYDWVAGCDFGAICQEYGMDAGTLMKIILKVANILEEWTTLATFSEDLEMLEKLRGVKENLVRGIVVPDSLYLRL